MSKIRVSFYEDNARLSETLTWIIESCEDFILVGVHFDATEVIEDLKNELPDVVLMDIEMPQMTGIDAVRLISEKSPHLPKILMFTVFEDTSRIFEAIKAGAVGYLLKNTSGEKIIEGIRDVSKGGGAMSPAIALKVLSSFQEPKANPYDLTTREVGVLRRLVEGDSYKLIAAHFFISINTVEKHILHIYQKLQVNSKGEAITKAFRDKLI
ncbi:response regulator [Emticicia sp. CRIBPO]|uniref:response regulator transcription factor n=1 Tax=Emticicia sp. CRIBPO TaxID=2683258 RepID=UPI0014128732|nr:response regulator transcription factor [Emticicia sp. CRIBPO]NBA87815.1 response regulator [Emticicia sp. CRIBPO]